MAPSPRFTLIHRPDLYGSAIIESPALEVGNGQLSRDTEFLVRTPSRIAVGAGAGEDVDRFGSNAAYIRMVQRLVQNLKAAYLSGEVQLTITEGESRNGAG